MNEGFQSMPGLFTVLFLLGFLLGCFLFCSFFLCHSCTSLKNMFTCGLIPRVLSLDVFCLPCMVPAIKISRTDNLFFVGLSGWKQPVPCRVRRHGHILMTTTLFALIAALWSSLDRQADWELYLQTNALSIPGLLPTGGRACQRTSSICFWLLFVSWFVSALSEYL